MRICLIGPPGAGKTTLAIMLSGIYKLPYVSTGEVLREMMQDGTPLAKELKSLFNKGELAPPETVVKVMGEELNKSLYRDGFIMDGSPRTEYEAKHIGKEGFYCSTPIDYIFLLDACWQTVKERLTTRARFDDTVESIERRYNIFNENINSIIHELVLSFRVKKINANGNRLQVLSQILTWKGE